MITWAPLSPWAPCPSSTAARAPSLFSAAHGKIISGEKLRSKKLWISWPLGQMHNHYCILGDRKKVRSCSNKVSQNIICAATTDAKSSLSLCSRNWLYPFVQSQWGKRELNHTDHVHKNLTVYTSYQCINLEFINTYVCLYINTCIYLTSVCVNIWRLCV